MVLYLTGLTGVCGAVPDWLDRCVCGAVTDLTGVCDAVTDLTGVCGAVPDWLDRCVWCCA